MLHRLVPLAMLIGAMLQVSEASGPPVARFQSVLGDFDVLLDRAAAPISVDNFASYANRGSYSSTFIHRSTTYNPAGIQIVQGGGFELVGNSIAPIATDPPIPLEAGAPNARGTLAMARGTALNSATSQWYFNVTDNPGLDFSYAVFGRVLGSGISVIDAIGAVPVYDASSQLGIPFSEFPLLNPAILATNLVLFNAVNVQDFAITNITRTGSSAELRWTALSSNTPVRVERRADLASGPWVVIGTNLTSGSFTDTNAPSAASFYRLVTEP